MRAAYWSSMALALLAKSRAFRSQPESASVTGIRIIAALLMRICTPLKSNGRKGDHARQVIQELSDLAGFEAGCVISGEPLSGYLQGLLIGAAIDGVAAELEPPPGNAVADHRQGSRRLMLGRYA